MRQNIGDVGGRARGARHRDAERLQADDRRGEHDVGGAERSKEERSLAGAAGYE